MPIYQKINQIMKLVSGVEKTGHNKHGGYNYAGHEALTAVLRGHFASLGVVRSASMRNGRILDGGHFIGDVTVTYRDIEDSSEASFEMPGVAHCQTKGGNVTAQQPGAALSFAVKNIEFKLFALTGDPDANSFEGGPYDTADIRGSEAPSQPDNASSGAREKAKAWLKEYETVKSKEEIDALTKRFRDNWDELSSVPGLADSVTSMRANARQRLANGNSV